MKKLDIDYEYNESPVFTSLIGKWIYVKDICYGSSISHFVVHITGTVMDDEYPHYTTDEIHQLIEPLYMDENDDCDKALDKLINTEGIPQDVLSQLISLRKRAIPKYSYVRPTIKEFWFWNGREVWEFENNIDALEFIDKFRELMGTDILKEKLELV